MALWQGIYLIVAIYGIGGNWRSIWTNLRRDPGGAIFGIIIIGLLLVPASMLLAYLVDWIRNLNIPPPP